MARRGVDGHHALMMSHGACEWAHMCRRLVAGGSLRLRSLQPLPPGSACVLQALAAVGTWQDAQLDVGHAPPRLPT